VPAISAEDRIICADDGSIPLISSGIYPDILIGDLDSISKEKVEEMEREGVMIERFPRDKDLSDGELAVRKAVSFSPERIEIYGGKGGRSDHILSSFQLLFIVPHEIQTVLNLDDDEIILMREGNSLESTTGKTVISILPASKRSRVTVSGMKWNLSDHLLEVGTTLGIHNEVKDGSFRLTVNEGDVFLIMADDDG
jgi:thiamine pyrophosphokinase